MLHAERQSCKKSTAKFSWSPDMVQSVHAKRYWKLMLKRARGLPVATSTLERQWQASKESPPPQQITLQDIIGKLRLAKESWKENQKRHYSLRESYLEQLATAIVLSKSPQLEDPSYSQKLEARTKQAIKRILKNEWRQRMYRQIGACLNPTSENAGGISRVDIPAPSDDTPVESIDVTQWRGPWRSITDPTEISFHICNVNKKQYNQAQDTPFASGPFAVSLGNVLKSTVANEILQGAFTPFTAGTLLQETSS